MEKLRQQEIELKLQLAIAAEWEDVFNFIKQLKGIVKIEQINLAARYFDTLGDDLNKEKIAYRVRKENEKWIATIKGGGSAAGGLHCRAEWNVKVDDGEPNLAVFEKTSINQETLKKLMVKALIIIVETVFTRNLILVKWNDSLIEIALDKGWIFGGLSKAPILEVELELKEGNREDLLNLGAELAKKFALIVEPKSKLLRGLELAGKIMPKKQIKNDPQSVIVAIHQLLSLIYDEWINKEKIDLKQYDKQIKFICRECAISKEEYLNLTLWLKCKGSEKIINQKLAVASLLLLWSIQK